MKKDFKFGELYCGPGGLALGGIDASGNYGDDLLSIAPIWGNDYDPNACATYDLNIHHLKGHTICQDVRKLNVDKLGKVDAFAYGFPCNDFSNVGEKKGFQGEYGPLYSYGLSVIEHSNPTFFVAENVGGLSSANEGYAFKKILEDLKSSGSGYDLVVNLYKAEEYGVPQTRHRIVIVGTRADLGYRFKVPAPTTKNRHVSSREAIENPPILASALNNEKTNQNERVVERLKFIKPGENAWNADLPDHLKLNVKGARISQIYKRLDPDQPSYTVTGSGGGGTHVYHWSENRALTNRERARLQTFPDTFEFVGSKESVRKQIGMAVPPRLSCAIFTAIFKTMADVPYPYVRPTFLDVSEQQKLKAVA